MKKPSRKGPAEAQSMLTHWQEAVPNDRLAHLVKDVTRAFIRALQARLTQHGVSFGHWTFLRVLWETGGLTQRELSDQAGVMEPTTFAAIKAMEKLGYVVRTRRPDNRHKVYIHLTPRGRLLKSKLVPLAEEVNGIGVRGIKSADIAAARLTLLAMLENLARDEIESAYSSRRIPVTQRHLDEGQRLAKRRTRG
ncbi:MAG: MarR family transcriptional regulator [Xanthobacteraceae bacterium]|nr:MarR family transcriptional regulator [Xanthobacteraceae bacterium]